MSRYADMVWRDPQEVIHIQVEFADRDPFEYRLLKDGREVTGVVVDGERYVKEER